MIGPAAAQLAGAVAALAAVLALIVLAGRIARARLPAQQGTPALHLRASLALDARRRLHLLETAHGDVLVLTGGAQDRLLALPARNDAA
jgi:flagellar biogenesis protein FliO